MELYRNQSNNLHREDGPAVLTPHMLVWVVNGKPHRANGPAFMSINGTRKHYWKGIFIESEYWNKKDSMSASEIFKIRNVEVRRCLIEMIGYEKFLKRAEAEIVEEDVKTGAILYKVPMPEDDEGEPLVVVKVLDGTPVRDETGEFVRKQYFIRVPPDTDTCAKAIAWTFEMTPEEYGELEKET